MWSMSDAAWRSPLFYLILTVLASSLFGIVSATPLGKRADDGNELDKFRQEVGDLFTETVGRYSPKGKLDLPNEDKRRLVWIIEGVNTAVKNGDLDESLYVIGDNSDPESETFKAAEKMAEQNSGETWTKLTGETTSKKLKARADGDNGVDPSNPWNEGLNSVGRLLQKLNLQQEKDNKVPKNERVGTKPSGPLQTAMDAVMRTRFVQRIIEINTPTQEQIDTVNEIFALINENTRTRDQLWKAQLKNKFPRVFTKMWGELKEGELANAEKERKAALANFEEYSSHVSGTIPDQKRRLVKMGNSIKGKLKQIFKMNDAMTMESPSGDSVEIPEGYVMRKPSKSAASSQPIGRDTVFFRFDFEPAYVVTAEGKSVFYDVDKNGKRTISKNQRPPRPMSEMFADADKGDTEVVPVDEGRLYDMSRKRFGRQPAKGQPLKFTEAANQAPPNPDDVGDSGLTDNEVNQMIEQNRRNRRPGQRPQTVDSNVNPDGESAETVDGGSDDPRRPKGGARRPAAKEPTGGKVREPAGEPSGGRKRPPGSKPPPNRRPPPPPRTGGGKGGRG